MKDFRKLVVWEKSHQLTLEIYKATSVFPTSEKYGLTSQMRRSASSIPSNIAEGGGRGTDAELARFCRIALGSASELEYQLQLSKELSFLKVDTFDDLDRKVNEVQKMLTALIKRLTTKS